MATRVYLSLGSNVEAEKNLQLAVRELRRRYGDLELSPVYRSKAVGFDGEDFLNLVVACDVDRSVEALAEEIEDIHDLAGRRRGAARFAARPLDIDVLLFGRLVTPGPPLELPRPDVLRYSFVLKPLADVAPDEIHPETGKSFAEHWRAMASADGELRRVALEFD